MQLKRTDVEKSAIFDFFHLSGADARGNWPNSLFVIVDLQKHNGPNGDDVFLS